jgi:hypothetical protein
MAAFPASTKPPKPLPIPATRIVAEVKEWLTDYDPDTIDELPKKALRRVANRRNAARARLAQKKSASS